MNVKRLLAGILLASMTLSMVACSSSSSTTTETETTTTTTTTTTDTTTTEADSNPYGLKADGLYSCSDEPLTLSVFCHWQGIYVLTDNMAIPEEMTRYTNIAIDGVAPEYNNDSDQAFNLLMTDPVLPDLVGGNVVDINTYAAEGAFIPLNDLLEEYAPNIMNAFERFPEAAASVTMDDGNIYAVPFIYEEVISQAWFIRQDWLDILGLEVPTTFDEFEAVMYAFRDGDPNGNGEADEIAFFKRMGTDDVKITALLQLFGLSGFWHIDEDTDKVQIAFYQEEYKDAMIKVSEWYADGLIYPEIYTTDNSTRDLLYPDDNGGITLDWLPSTSAYNTSIPEIEGLENFYLSAMLPPADINGDVWTAYSRLRTDGYGWGISCDNQYPVESIKFMDFLFSDQGRDVTTYGVEGETYYYDDNGDPIYMDYMFEGDESLVTMIYKMGGSLKPMAFLHDATYEFQVMHEEGAVATEMYAEAGVVATHLAQLPTLSLTLEESDIITSLYPTCLSYIQEKAEAWTYDGSRIEAEFDEYMANLSDMGMDQVIEVYQNAYDRMMSN